jgi:hypothetical protein
LAVLEVRLGPWVGLDVVRCKQTSAETSQVGPAQLTTDRPFQMVRDPFGDGAAVPAVVLRRWAAHHHQQLILLRCGQQSSAGPVLAPEVLDPVRSLRL